MFENPQLRTELTLDQSEYLKFLLSEKERFEKEEDNAKAGDKEAQPNDLEFVEALEYGMPPTSGWGMGIDRLVSLLTDQVSLKDVILFPTLRPEFAAPSAPVVVKPEAPIDPSQTISKTDAHLLLHAHSCCLTFYCSGKQKLCVR